MKELKRLNVLVDYTGNRLIICTCYNEGSEAMLSSWSPYKGGKAHTEGYSSLTEVFYEYLDHGHCLFPYELLFKVP